MVGLITHNRLGLLQVSLDSLRRAGASDVLIQDDASNAETKRAILSSGWQVKENKERLGADRNTFQLCDFLSQHFDHFVISGSDVLYAEGFEAELEDLYQKYRHLGVAMVGGFLGTNHRLRTYDFMGKCLLAETLTGPTLVSSEFWKANRGYIDANECDVSMSRIAMANGWRVLCVKNSICQHIGIRDGLHAKHGDAPDLAVRFVGEDRSLKYDAKRSASATLIDSWDHNRGESVLRLWSDGSTDFGSDFGTWTRVGNLLRIRDSVWSTDVVISGNSYAGRAYPNGASMVWFEVTGERYR